MSRLSGTLDPRLFDIELAPARTVGVLSVTYHAACVVALLSLNLGYATTSLCFFVCAFSGCYHWIKCQQFSQGRLVFKDSAWCWISTDGAQWPVSCDFFFVTSGAVAAKLRGLPANGSSCLIMTRGSAIGDGWRQLHLYVRSERQSRPEPQN